MRNIAQLHADLLVENACDVNHEYGHEQRHRCGEFVFDFMHVARCAHRNISNLDDEINRQVRNHFCLMNKWIHFRLCSHN